MQTQKISGFQLAAQQKRLWHLQQHSSAFCSQCSILIDGNLQPEILQNATQEIVNHHDILRTSFYCPPGLKTPVMVVADKDLFNWEYLDLSDSFQEDISGKLEELFWQARQEHQKLAQVSPLRLFLIKLSDIQHILIISLPALCADNRTIKNLVNQISQGYEKCCQGKEVSGDYVQYVQFSEWQNQLLADEDAEEAKAYWQQQKINSLSALKLPHERQRNNQQFITERYQLVISQELFTQIDAFAQKYEKTPDIVLLACWQILIWRLTGESEIVIGTASARREYEELNNVLGLLATWLPIKTKFTPNLNFTEVLATVAQTLENAAEWQDYFVPEAVEENNSIAFPIGFEFANIDETKSDNTTVKFTLQDIYSVIEPFKVKLTCLQNNHGLITEFDYDSNYFDQETIQRIAKNFQTLLINIFSNPNIAISQLEIISNVERQKLLVEFNQTKADYQSDKCIHQLFEEQVEKTPNAVAVVFENEKITYQELNLKANQLAHYLQKLGVKPEVVVGICVERNIQFIISLLAVLKAGGAYLPIDPTLPPEALQFRLQDAQASVLIREHREQGIGDSEQFVKITEVVLDSDWENIYQESTDNLVNNVQPENLVYIIYTSGSTGKAKGVAVEHQQLLNYLYGILPKLQLPTNASYATVSTFAADLGNTVIFPCLSSGGCLHIVSWERASDPAALADYFRRYPIDCLKIVPSHLAALLSSECWEIVPRQLLILGGEAADWNLIEKIEKNVPHCRILNHYGPTETTVGVLTYSVGEKIQDTATVPIGKPIANTQVYVLDANLQPVPLGVAGELYIGGESLARGYLNQSELTAQRFITNPFSDGEERFYKTGDRVRYLSNGNLEFLGRLDDQVKIRGYRIELGEISTALSQHPAVKENVVIAWADELGNKRLIAYFVPHQSKFEVSDLRNFLKQKLPDYMIPSAFVLLKKLPLTANGKVDRQALPDPDQVRPELAETFTPPRNPVEEKIAQIWAQVLQIERVGINDNFFELGGDSIMTIQIAARANQAGIKVTPKQMFENPTVAGLAAVTNIYQSSTITNSPSQNSIDYALLKQKLPVGLQIENIEDIYELTPVQQGILFHSLYAPELGLYVFQTRLALQGVLNLEAFEQAWQQVVERQSILRTSFHWQDLEQPLEVVYKKVKVPVQQQDLRGMDTHEQQRQLKSFLASDRTSGFDLSQIPLMRLNLFRLADNYYEFVWSRHFIIADGWSIPLILGEVVQIYEAISQNQEEYLAPTTPFRNYIQWLQQQDVSQAEGFWRRLLNGFKTPTPLTHLYVDGLSHQEEKYDDQQITLSVETTSALYSFARQHRITLNTIIQGAWAFLISRYSIQEEVIYGCTVSGRPPELAGAESIVGMLVNTLPVRVKVDPQQPLLVWLQQLQLQLLEMRQYEYTSLVELQAWSQVPRGVSLFDSIVVFENLPVPEALREGQRSIQVSDSSNFYKINYPLTVVVIPGFPLVIGINYDFNRVDIATINGILTQLNILLQNMVANPDVCLGDLELLTEREKQITLMLEKEAIFNFGD